MKKVVTIILIILFLGIVVFKVKSKIDSKGQVDQGSSGRYRMSSTTVVKVWRVVPQELKESLTVVGDIATHSEVIIQPRISGRLLEMLVEEGDKVKKSQLLAVIDDQTIKLQLQQAENNIAVIKANLNQAELKMAQAKAEKERYKELLEHRYISQSDYDNVENTYLNALASVEIVKEQLSSAEKNQELLEIQLNQTRIYSPIDGYVFERHVTAGMNITTGTEMLTIASLSPVKLQFNIDQKDAARIRKGTPVEFVTDALPDRIFKGKIDRTSSTYDTNTRTMSFSVRFTNETANLEPGMFGTAEVILSDNKMTLAFPQEALVTVDGENGVFVIDQNLSATFKTVVTGMIVNNMVEAVSGLEEGDQVVVVGQTNLRVGQKVEILDDGANNKETDGVGLIKGDTEMKPDTKERANQKTPGGERDRQ